MNIEELQLITRTGTATGIIRHLAENRKISNEIILRFFKTTLMKRGLLVVEEEFNRFFKEMEEIGVGHHNDFNGQPAGRFVSKFILADICEQILNPNKQMDLRLVGSPRVTTQYTSAIPGRVVINPVVNSPSAQPMPVPDAPPKRKPTRRKVPMASIPVVSSTPVFIFKTLANDYIPFPLNEIDRLVEEAKLIRSKMVC